MLNEKHTHEFTALSGINADMIERCGVRSVGAAEAHKYIGNSPDEMRGWPSGWVIPYLFPNEDVPTYWRFKPDYPRSNADDKPIKYESPKKSQNRLYIPPGFNDLANGKGKIIITEGEKKALKATQEGFATLGLSGVWNWQQKRVRDDSGKAIGERRLIRDFQFVPLHKRTVIITFDSDIEQNESVMRAMACLADVLMRDYKCTVLDGRIPYRDGDKMGLDDFLVQYGRGAYQKIVDMAAEVERPSKLRAIDWAKQYVETQAHWVSPDGHVNCRTIHYWRDELWRWNKRCWEKFAFNELKCKVHLWLDDQGASASVRQAREVTECIQSLCLLPSSVNANEFTDSTRRFLYPDRDFIQAKNGIVRLADVGREGAYPIHEPTPEFFGQNALDYDFSPRPLPPSRWIRFLSEIWEGDQESIDTLQEWFGYCLLPSTELQKIMLVVGPKRSGKGTIARILRKLVGEHNCVSPTLDSLTKQFGLQPLLDRSVAIVSDARLSGRADRSLVVERLLTISGEDAVTIDRKNLPTITTQLMTRFTIFTNELPQLRDVSGALASRFIILRLNETFFGREDVDLSEKLADERQGILMWAIEGWRRVRKQKRIMEPVTSGMARESMDDISSPLNQFLVELCEVGSGEEFTVRTDDIYQVWKAWCKHEEVFWKGSRSQFGRDLMATVPRVDRARVRGAGGDSTRHYVYRGIRLVGPKVPVESEMLK